MNSARGTGAEGLDVMEVTSTSYKTTCSGCKVPVELDMKTWDAVVRSDDGDYSARLSVARKRTKHGDLWGLLVTVTWMCPVCLKTHKDKTWTPDSQVMLPGFDWGLVK